MVRRGKFGAKKRAAYLEALRRGLRRGLAAKQAGIHRETARLAYNGDPEFAAAVELAELDSCEPIEDAMYQAALAGSVVAIQVWLYNRSPTRWRDQRRVEHSGPEGRPIPVQIRTMTAEVDADLLGPPT